MTLKTDVTSKIVVKVMRYTCYVWLLSILTERDKNPHWEIPTAFITVQQADMNKHQPT